MTNRDIPIVRIQKIKIFNFKNVENGAIEFKNNIMENDINNKAEILGIYGQNGSGKTALVDASFFLKNLLSRLPLPNDLFNYMNANSQSSKLEFEFYAKINENLFLITYEIGLKKINNDSYISFERLAYSKNINNEWTNKSTIIEYDSDSEELFTPKYRYKKIINDKDNNINLRVIQKLSIQKKMSFIFNDETLNIIRAALEKEELNNIIESLTYFARCNLFVIPNNHNAIISMNLLMPFSFRLEQEKGIASGDVAVGLDGLSLISNNEFKILKNVINQMNVVLSIIIPSLNVELYDYGEQLDEKGNIKQKVELLSVRENTRIPIRYESEGIKKIISILSALIAVYNNKSICMIVDELDSGVYEFLLGELLKVLDNGGKGQLIFTSHNLRPLEILKKDSVYFTTTNPSNRYIHFSQVKPTHNLRSLYLRSINLGGQKENLYNETDELEIRRAFRLAGDEKKYDI